MKNISLTLLFIASVATTTHAQVGAELGLNMANLAIKSGGTTVKTTFKPGFAIGLIADMAVSQHAYFEPGLFYEMTGAKITSTPAGKYSINTVTIPLNIEFKSGEKCGNRFFVGLGPYIGYNVGGNYSINAYGSLPATAAPLEIGTAKNDNMKALDLGAGINLGYLLKSRLYARAHYQVGLTDLNPASDGANTVKTSAFGITIGYLFGRCDSYKSIPGFHNSKNNHWRGMSKGKYSTKRRYLRD